MVSQTSKQSKLDIVCCSYWSFFQVVFVEIALIPIYLKQVNSVFVLWMLMFFLFKVLVLFSYLENIFLLQKNVTIIHAYFIPLLLFCFYIKGKILISECIHFVTLLNPVTYYSHRYLKFTCEVYKTIRNNVVMVDYVMI